MGNIAGKRLKAKQRRVAGVGAEGEEIVDPEAWCENFATHEFAKVKEVYETLDSEQKA